MVMMQYTRPYKLAAAGALTYSRYPYTQRQSQMYTSGPSRTMTTFKRKRNSYPRKSFKKQVESIKPAKHFAGNPGIGMAHDTIYSYNPTSQIIQGTGNVNRDGDSIHIAALKFKGFLNSHTTAGAYSYRILIGWSGEEYNLGTGFTNAGLTAGEIFLPLTVTGTNVNGIVNPKAFTVLFDQVVDINSQISGAYDLASFNTTISIDQDFDYQSTASVYGKTRNLYIVCIGQVVGGTAGATAVGTMNGAVDLIFK